MWLAAITLGVAGSFHCLGMCSPLLMAVTSQQSFSTSRLIYNAGRILTYCILGSIVGMVGTIVDLTGFQKYLSIVAGLLLIILGAFTLRSVHIPFVSTWIRKQFSKFISQKGFTTTFTLGMLNGLLPCGLTSIALVYCVALDPINGSLYMLVFGLSTLPVMLGLTSFVSKWWSGKHIPRVAMIMVGVLLIARPYISHTEHARPERAQGEVPICK
ncbi:MAG TPA: sulfite exporter TauE/SafE family protein [Cyclobacteriaceae bacterium]|nr:sulfite exporter TauE/SafE family protein [Cyclobacteriaceae bacterium]